MPLALPDPAFARLIITVIIFHELQFKYNDGHPRRTVRRSCFFRPRSKNKAKE